MTLASAKVVDDTRICERNQYAERHFGLTNLSAKVINNSGISERVQYAERHSRVGGATSGWIVVIAVDSKHGNGHVEIRVVIIGPRKPTVSLEVDRQIADNVKLHFFVAECVFSE